MNRQQLKEMSKEQIKGNLGILFVISLIISLISAAIGVVASFIPVQGLQSIGSLLTPGFTLSFAQIYLGVALGRKPEASDAFGGFSDFWTAFKVSFLVGLYTILWSLLLIVPGIIKGYSYSQAMYIAAENPGISAREAIRRSQEMMDGHKAELFTLQLSFIGWWLLAILTCGFLGIWLVPYYDTTLANFYLALKPAAPTSEFAPETAPQPTF